MTKFARDEFDRVPQNTSRQGVHRDAQETARPTLWPVLTVGAVALVLGLVAFLILPRLGLVAPGASSSVSTPAPQQSDSTPSPGSSESSAPIASGEPSPGTSPSGVPSETPSSAPVDKTTVISVYNGTATAGLASRVAGLVQGDGWPLGTVGNWGGLPQQTSVIFYNGPTQKANADALGSLLGIKSIVESPEIQQPVVVVVGPGYQ
ncbi:LytR C-terminal domain-containing protein [Paenarthrobacter sp. NPDC092416]|uniref:LytR C-terminal domain-containing protein n=1 Tax=Paenarthrobacter sp. NPDC092416 TaxID=3364386 RepID=UPI00381C1042